MFDFSSWLNLPLIWGGLIGVAIFMYVLLDGFDLGIGIIIPFAPSASAQKAMLYAMAPFWDGNETWLVLGGGGLFAAFPLAYSILLPAFYLPIMLMLFGLIGRGVAFEFCFKTQNRAWQFWKYVFHGGSLLATFAQGMVLGAFIQGVSVQARHFAGTPFDWLSSFSLITGLALIAGYALLGSTWLMMKTDVVIQYWARQVAGYALGTVGIFMVLVSLIAPYVTPIIHDVWLQTPTRYYLAILPLSASILFIALAHHLFFYYYKWLPFVLAFGIFFMCYLGLAISLFPWIIPFHYTLKQAAASGPGLSLLLVGAIPLLPLILGYTGFCYFLFRHQLTQSNFYG